MSCHVYYVNLKRSTQRNQQIRRQLANAGALHVSTRIEGVDGRKLQEHEFRRHVTPTCSRFCTRSIIGCAMSHLHVWQTFIDSAHEYAVILEDDAQIQTNDLLGAVSDAIAHVPSDWEVLYLGSFVGSTVESNYSPARAMLAMIAGSTSLTVPVNDAVVRPSLPMGNHGYVIHRRSALRLLDHFRANPIWTHVDLQMNYVFNRLGMKVYALKTPVVVQSTTVSVSNIASTQFPVLLNRALDSLVNSDGQSMAYLSNVSLYETWPSNPKMSLKVNLWLAIVVLLALATARIPLRTVATAYATLLLADLVVTRGDAGVLFTAAANFAIIVLVRTATTII